MENQSHRVLSFNIKYIVKVHYLELSQAHHLWILGTLALRVVLSVNSIS